MNLEEIRQMFLAQTAILIYEIILMAVLLVLLIVLIKKRKQRKQLQMTMQERQISRSLDDSLSNQKRR